MEEQIPGERRYLMTGTVDEKVEWGLKAEKWNCNYFLSRSTYPSLSYLVPREERQEPCPNIAVSRREREKERERERERSPLFPRIKTILRTR